ncbi:MAG: immune inhibitor A [Bryobacterales bacterium]|nr:immune inhibitor A [Bryobacterales bacterium]
MKPRLIPLLVLASFLTPALHGQDLLFPGNKERDIPNPIQAARWRERLRQVEAQRRSEETEKQPAEPAALAGTGRILVILVEFGGTDTFEFIPTGPNKSTWDPIGKADSSEWTGTVGDCSAIIQKYNITGPQMFTYSGPLHNQIERPRSASDVSGDTVWAPDFNRQYYQDLIAGNGVKYQFSRQDGSPVNEDHTGRSVRSYYQDMSGGAYNLTADVVGWVQVPHSIWWYGADPCPGRRSGSSSTVSSGAIPTGGTDRSLVIDAIEAVKLANPTMNWAQYDQDHDGIIDHLWIIHAGIGQSESSTLLNRTTYGEATLWQHAGTIGPAYQVVPGISAGPFLMMSENTGLSTLAHEFGHGLGADDLYATEGGYSHLGHTSTGFWSLMADNWVGVPPASQPPAMDPWHLDFWGWLNPLVISAPTREYTVKLKQASGPPPTPGSYKGVKILLPDGRATHPVQPASGQQWWGGAQNDTNSRMTLASPVALPSTQPIALSFSTAYKTEQGWDFFWVQVSKDAGRTWKTLTNSHTTCQHERTWKGSDEGFPDDLCAAGIGGFTGASPGFPNRVTETFDLSSYAGQQILLRLWYMTDAAVIEDGVYVDNIVITCAGSPVFADNGDSGDRNWNYAGPWARNDGTLAFTHAYYLQWRNVSSTGGFDSGLGDARWRYGPANTGLLVWYNNDRYADNEIDQYLFHPPSFGPKGRMLVVDAHPEPYRNPDRVSAGFDNEAANLVSRSLMRDATFSLADSVPFTYLGVNYPGRPAVSRFSDGLGYYPGLELVSPGPNEPNPKRWITKQWDASVVLPSTKPYPAKAPGYTGNEEVLYDCWAYTGLGTLGCTSRGRNLSLGAAGGDGMPLTTGGQYGWNVQIVSQTDSEATLRIWNGLYTVNAASFAAATPVAPGSLAAIFGDFLAPSVQAAQSLPLPTSLNGVSVTVNGVPAPLHFVSPGQINMQIPYGTAPGSATVVVTNGAIPAYTGRLQIAATAPGIFLNGDHAVAWNNDTSKFNTATSAAPAGGLIVVYTTGQGPVSPAIPTGEGPGAALSLPVGQVTATIGGQAAAVEWAGMTPLCAGVMQVHIRVPNLQSGSYPLVISVDGRASNSPLITVARP